MNEWCITNHNASGLVKQCLESKLTIEEADEQLNRLMSELNITKGLLAGNSVSESLIKTLLKFELINTIYI